MILKLKFNANLNTYSFIRLKLLIKTKMKEQNHFYHLLKFNIFNLTIFLQSPHNSYTIMALDLLMFLKY